MSYPKPLSEKTLERMYSQSGLSEEVRSFLHTFFAACANFYGAVSLRTVWDVYKHMENVPFLRRKDMLAFSSIARREALPYYIYEIEELYSEEPHNELSRYIVLRDIVGSRGYPMFYHLTDMASEYPVYIPKDLLSYANPTPIKEERELLEFLSELESTADECTSDDGEAVPNENKGKKLSEFSFLNSDERFDAEYYKNNPKMLARLKEKTSVSEAQKIINHYKLIDSLDFFDCNYYTQSIFDELNEVGVMMSYEQADRLAKLAVDYHNYSHHWSLCGWSPYELSLKHSDKKPSSVSLSFGPGLQKDFAEKKLDKDEIVSYLREMGFDVIE